MKYGGITIAAAALCLAAKAMTLGNYKDGLIFVTPNADKTGGAIMTWVGRY